MNALRYWPKSDAELAVDAAEQLRYLIVALEAQVSELRAFEEADDRRLLVLAEDLLAARVALRALTARFGARMAVVEDRAP